MFAKYTLKYNYEGSEDMAPVDISFEIPGDVTLTQILYQFENFLKASGFVFDGKLDFVEDTYPEHLDQIEQEPGYGCMADWDDEEIEAEEDSLKKWNEDLRELEERIKEDRASEQYEKEVKKNNWVHGICNPPSADWKATHSQKEYVEGCKPTGKRYSSVQ